jgi:hypothetical protein
MVSPNNFQREEASASFGSWFRLDVLRQPAVLRKRLAGGIADGAQPSESQNL